MDKFSETTIVAALEEYKECVSRHNFVAAKRLVDYATNCPTPDELLEDAEEDLDWLKELEDNRLKYCLDTLSYSFKPPGQPSKPEDIITRWDEFSRQTGLNGAAVIGTPEERAKHCTDSIRGLRDGLTELGGDAAELEVPGDFAILLKHADTLEGHGWGKDMKHLGGCIFFDGFRDYDAAKASVYVGEELGGSPAFAGYLEFSHVVAGFKTGFVFEGGSFMIYGTLADEEESKWFYYLNMGQNGTSIFDNLIDLLAWYQTYGLAYPQDIEDDIHGFWGMGASWSPGSDYPFYL